MASPIDTLKNSLFDQLKSYGDTVQDVFEQRIARPLLALKRDFSRPSSTTRNAYEQESTTIPSDQISSVKQQESELSSTSTDIIDIETSIPLKTVLDKVKYTFLPTTKQCISEIATIEEANKPNRDCRHASISSLSKKNHPRNLMRHKSVSFAENSIQYHDDDDETDTNNQYSINDQTDVLDNSNTVSHHILMSRINETTTNPMNSIDTLSSLEDDNEDDFARKFYQSIRPRRISIGNSQDLIYQDLSAEIVSYVLKHALRTLEKEDQDLSLKQNVQALNKNEYDEDFIDLK